MFSALFPKDELSEAEVNSGMRTLVLDAMYGQTMGVLTTGAFLIGFALQLGANNAVIGILSGLGPLALAMQVPAVYLVQRLRRRKLIVVVMCTLSRIVWLAIPFLPFLLPEKAVIPAFLALLLFHYGTGNIGGCAFNSWIRDLIPEKRLSSFFVRRLGMATAAGALMSLLGGFTVDGWKRFAEKLPGNEVGGYGVVFVVATIAGMMSVYYLVRTPESKMPAADGQGFLAALWQPLGDANFRQLLIFLGSWNFAINFAAPFFAVYLLRRLDMSMAWVIGLSVFSQLVNVLFFRLWGGLSDRFSNKSVIMFNVPLFIFSFLLWPFTTMPGPYFLTIPILIVAHIMAGIGTAGVNLCANNLALKLAPYGRGGNYLAVNSMVSGLAAMISPVIAGFSADWFETKVITLTLHAGSTLNPEGGMEFPAMDFRGLDFLFLIAFVMGLYAMHRLLSVREEGEVKESVVRQAFFAEMARTVRQVSTAAGVRQTISAPFTIIRELGGRQEEPQPEAVAENTPS